MSTATPEKSAAKVETPAEVNASPEVETKPTTPAASIDSLTDMQKAAVTLGIQAYNGFNAVKTANLASSKTVDEIAESLSETSTNEDVQKINDALEDLRAKRLAILKTEAEAIKAKAGEPNEEAEKKAKKDLEAARTVMAMTLDGINVDHLLPTLVSGSTVRKIGANTSGPKRDLSEVREWAKKNTALLPEGITVGDRGRIHADVLAAYTKATGKSVE